jgi:large subunit ribosomal protein L24
MHIVKGMMVKVISGNHKGQSGKVLDIFPKKMKAIVEGVNFRKRSVRPTQDNPSGGYVDREAPLHLSNLMVLHNDQATRIGYKKLENGKKVRISVKTREEL